MPECSDPWRQRCPEGHSSLTVFETGYRCTACGVTYDGTPYDAGAHEFPVEDGPEFETVDDAVRALYYRTRNTSTTARAAELGEHTRGIGQRLTEAERRGLVERIGASSPYRWRLTEAGYWKARPVQDSLVADVVTAYRDELRRGPVEM